MKNDRCPQSVYAALCEAKNKIMKTDDELWAGRAATDKLHLCAEHRLWSEHDGPAGALFFAFFALSSFAIWIGTMPEHSLGWLYGTMAVLGVIILPFAALLLGFSAVGLDTLRKRDRCSSCRHFFVWNRRDELNAVLNSYDAVKFAIAKLWPEISETGVSVASVGNVAGQAGHYLDQTMTERVLRAMAEQIPFFRIDTTIENAVLKVVAEKIPS